MKVLVLGAGVIGVTSAYYLAKSGHEVIVVDRQSGPGLETSFANAGEISPGYASPWAGPGIPLKAIKWLFMRHGPLVLRPRLDPRMWQWILLMLRNCTAARYAANKARMVGIAEYSRGCLQALRDETGIAYDERSLGTLQLFRTRKQLDGAARDIAILQQYHIPYEVLDAAGCAAVEPGLAPVQHMIAGGLRLPGDETGDCYQFTRRLATLAANAGVDFRYSVGIERIDAKSERVDGVHTTAGLLTADAYVLALGSFSPLLARPLGLSLPVYPVKGYSITVPITDPGLAPVSTVMDETFKVAITRLGDRIRVGGTAELSGYDQVLHPRRRAPLVRSLTDLFPSASNLTAATFWMGLRPMTPDGPPVIGKTRFGNLYVNTGHGTLGWTMACGSGRIIADLVSNKAPDIRPDSDVMRAVL